MAKTLAQIQKEIDRLQKEADALRQREVAEVVARIQEAITHYGLSAEDLFARATTRLGKRRAGAAPAKGAKTTLSAPTSRGARPAKKPAAPPKFHDGTGRTWSGHGKRPDWYKAAIAAGKSAEDLLIKA